MKTQIIQLEPHDDIISARDKMGWGQTSRILLIWPDSIRVLNRRLDLILLQRHTISLGAQLALVTRDSEVRFFARELAIPVFENLQKDQDSSWRTKHRRRPRIRSFHRISEYQQPDLTRLREEAHPPKPTWLSNPITRLALFLIGVMAFLSIVAILYPSAEIRLNPKTESQDITLQVYADPKITDINLSGAIPARPVRVTVEGRSSLPAQGTIQIPDKYATGRVTFTNLTNNTVLIPVGSVVRTLDPKPIRFMTMEAVEVPKEAGETISVPVQSIKPGKEGNLPAASLVAIEGPLGLSLAAKNLLPTRGGKDRIAPAPTTDDRVQLYQQLFGDLQLTAINELQDQLTQDDLLFTSTLSLTHVLEETFEPAEDLPSDHINLNLRMEFEVLTARGDDISTLVSRVLNANIPEDHISLPWTLNISALDEPQISGNGIARWRIYATRNLRVQLPETQTVNLTLGLPTKEAELRLVNSLPLKNPPQLAITPDWWPRMPLLPFRITLVQE